MGFVKGDERINRAGRPRGTPNRVNPPIKEMISGFLHDKWGTVERDFDKLEPRERMMVFEKLLAFVLPKPRELNIDLAMEKLTDAQLDEIVERIMQPNGKQ